MTRLKWKAVQPTLVSLQSGWTLQYYT